MNPKLFNELKASLLAAPRTWLITGVAGFIGSNLLEELLRLNQRVVGLDSFSTGYQKNLNEVETLVTRDQWARFTMHEADTRDLAACRQACEGVDYVLHQAALGSVPRSLSDPIATHDSNVNGFLNMLVAARDNSAKGFVYASSSSVYGDHPALPKVEERTGNPLSPYALSKAIGESYAAVFARCFDFHTVGLRYFNVFGPRQDPHSAYAAVIPKWTSALLRRERVSIYGDGETSRDFCYVANAVQANLLAATAEQSLVGSQVFNVAVGDRTTLAELLQLIRTSLARLGKTVESEILYEAFRPGDVRHSQADIAKARTHLGFQPSHTVADGLVETIPWYLANQT